MKEHSISSFFINNETFIQHFLSYENISLDDFHDMLLSIEEPIQGHSKKVNDMFNLDVEPRTSMNILPYFFITDVYIDNDRKQLFYLFLNKYINSVINDNEYKLNSCIDINNMFLALCYIYMIQYIFL